MIRFLIVYFLLNLAAHSADCSYSNGKILVSVKNGESVSLRDEGKSLADHEVQDQDGLGTCYANATSAVLKSVLPDHPDISYTNAALSSASHGWSQNWKNGKNNYIKNNENHFISGGYVCETIAGLKNSGGACPRDLSITEAESLNNSYIQERLFDGLGAYFDHINKIKNNPDLFEKFKDQLALSVETIKSANEDILLDCNKKKQKYPVESAISSIIENQFEILNKDNTPCSKARFEQLKKMLTENSIIEEDRIETEIDQAYQSKFKKIIEENAGIKIKVDKYLSDEYTYYNSKAFDKASSILLGKKIQVLLDDLGLEEVSKVCPAPAHILNESPQITGESFLKMMLFDKIDRCHELKDLIIDASPECRPIKDVDLITSALTPLVELGEILDDQMLSKLTSTDARYGNQLKNILTPECRDKQNLIPMNDLSCATFYMCDANKGIDNGVYNGPVGGCYNMSSARSMMRMQTIRNINQNKALGIGVCTSFFDNPDIKTNFCKDAGDGVEGHSYHEMTISGYRCVEGKIEYEILNSWGGHCIINNNDGVTFKNKAVECQQDEYGNPTGVMWIKEDVLVDSTLDISVVTQRKK